MKFRSLTALAPVSNVIDPGAPVIKGASLISIGPALGHGELVDETTLSQMLAEIQRQGAIKIKLNPETWDHGPGSVVGLVRAETARIDGGKLRGDIERMPGSADDKWAQVCAAATTLAKNCGISVVFDGESEVKDGVGYLRCTNLMEGTIVDSPAANMGGFLKEGDRPNNQPKKLKMDEETMKALKGCLAEATAPLAESLKALADSQVEMKTSMESRLKALEDGAKGDPDEKDPDCNGMSDEDKSNEMHAAGVVDADDKLSRNRKVHAYRRTLASPITLKTILSARDDKNHPLNMLAFSRPSGVALSHNLSNRRDNGERKFMGAAGDEFEEGTLVAEEFERLQAINLSKEHPQPTKVIRGNAIRLCVKKYPKEYGKHCQSIGLSNRHLRKVA